MKYLTVITALLLSVSLYAQQSQVDTTVSGGEIHEAVVTAVESKGTTATSKIGKDAISHIQPTSFADILELLPGGRAKDPSLSGPNLINLRSANSSVSNSDYATGALGTKFMIDGRPIGNDANLQSLPAWSNLGSSYVNYGTDMREISTDDIESVEIVRGIAGVEYGDLTSGLVKISRRKGGNDIRARFKSDMQSKLFYVSKGFEKNSLYFNASANYLNSQADPRNTRQNWKRLTGSLRSGYSWKGDRFLKSINGNFDYTGSFDNQKSDDDLDEGLGGTPVETYKSNYNKFSLGADFSLKAREDGFFRNWTTTMSMTYERDLIDRWKYYFSGADSPMSTSTEAGEYDAVIIPANYESRIKVDGRPFYYYLNSVANFRWKIHKIKAGFEWNVDKNFGEGSIYESDIEAVASQADRSRKYSDIPATHQLSLFLEESGTKAFGDYSAKWSVGLRAETLAGAGKDYDINFKPMLDPRANLRVDFPYAQFKGNLLKYGVFGGIGYHTKFPTMDQLYPDPVYKDFVQLNYWPVETNLRRINLLVYKLDPTNYSLGAARNLKWEIGADAEWNGFSLSVNYFREDMKSGFRYAYEYDSVIYKKYDTSTIDKSTLTGPPSTEGLSYSLDTTLTAYSYTENGSRTLKEGVEFTLTSPRIKAINTKITANGAWFRTRYMNSIPEYYVPSVMIEGKAYPYVGVYENNDGTLYEVLNTNIMLDTQIPSLGLIFSSSFQCQWFSGSQSMQQDISPIAYIDKTLTTHEWDESYSDDAVLHYLVRSDRSTLDEYMVVPFAMNVNLKVSKKLYHDKVSCALFVNKIFDVTPNYKRNNATVRRNVLPYFGMELNFTI